MSKNASRSSSRSLPRWWHTTLDIAQLIVAVAALVGLTISVSLAIKSPKLDYRIIGAYAIPADMAPAFEVSAGYAFVVPVLNIINSGDGDALIQDINLLSAGYDGVPQTLIEHEVFAKELCVTSNSRIFPSPFSVVPNGVVSQLPVYTTEFSREEPIVIELDVRANKQDRVVIKEQFSWDDDSWRAFLEGHAVKFTHKARPHIIKNGCK